MSAEPPLIGIYLYGWYDRGKWREHRCPSTPLPGYYRSSDPVLVAWQAEQIARSGVDFVAIEMVPHLDHSFTTIMSHARSIIPELARRGVGYVLLLDFLIFHQYANPVRLYAETMAILDREGMLTGTFDNPHLGRAVFLFHLSPDIVDSIRQATPKGLSIYPNSWQPTWGKVDISKYSAPYIAFFWPLWRTAVEGDLSLQHSLGSLGYFQFWRYTDTHPQVMNGIGSVVSGYDDMLLGRDPQIADTVSREGGRTLVEQMRQVVEGGARTIMIYGWNEYFEDAVIEPTVESGDFYLELTRALIGQVRRGEQVRFPQGLSAPGPASPVYLTEKLRQTAERHPDRVPRWDQDHYVALVEVPWPAVGEGGSVIFKDVRVTNGGTETWSPATAGEEIRVGVRLFTSGGAVVREGRARPTADLPQGAGATVDVPIEVAGLPNGDYVAGIDVVWEGRFWFETAGPRGTTMPLQIREGRVAAKTEGALPGAPSGSS